MQTLHPRIAREQKTIQKMAQLYCHANHGTESGTLCADCAALEKYALERLHRCPFQEKKSTCAKCLVHCYHPVMREKVRKMMRYAGPRMLRRHPVLALLHLADGLRKAPAPPRRSKPGS